MVIRPSADSERSNLIDRSRSCARRGAALRCAVGRQLVHLLRSFTLFQLPSAADPSSDHRTHARTHVKCPRTARTYHVPIMTAITSRALFSIHITAPVALWHKIETTAHEGLRLGSVERERERECRREGRCDVLRVLRRTARPVALAEQRHAAVSAL